MGYTFKLVSTNKIEGTLAPSINIIVNYCYTRVLLNAKMLKETETEETIRFFVTVLSLVVFQWRGAGPLATPMLLISGMTLFSSTSLYLSKFIITLIGKRDAPPE